MADSNKMTVRARLARIEDASQLDALLAVYRREIEARPPRPIEPGELGADGRRYVIVAEKTDDLVGMLAVQRCSDLRRDAPFLLLTDIFVRADSRREGVATAMMTEVEALARRLGCTRMSLIVAQIDNPALITAARAGFLQLKEILLSRELE